MSADIASAAPGGASGSGIGGWFGVAARGSTLRRAVLGGAATFLTMSYIVFVNPAILSAAGLDFEAVAVAAARAAALFDRQGVREGKGVCLGGSRFLLK